MLTEYQIEALPARISERLNRINAEYLEEIGRVVKEIGELRPSDVHKIQRMYQSGGKVTEIVQKLAKESEKNIFEIYDMFDIVAKENYNYSEPFYKAKGKPFIPYEDNAELQQYVKSLAKQTVGEYINATQHTAFAVFSNGGKSIAPLFDNNKDKVATSLSDTYTKVIDYAVSKVQTGVTGYQSAMREVMKAMADSGIRTVDYATGYSRRLESAVRQNILWGVKQCNQNTADMIGKEFGADGYEISYHSNPRPSHADMGGKQYAIGPARTVNGVRYPSFEKEAEPLLNDYGCLHFKFSILLGISRPAYSEEQLAQFKAEDNRKIEFEGKEYTRYEASQLQKRIESEVRRQKDRATIAKTSGDDIMRREAQYKINLLTNKYAKLSKESGLPTKMERMKSAVKPLTNGNSSGIIALNRVSSPKDFKPLDVERRNRIFENLRKQGIDIITGEEAIAYLDYKSEKEEEYIEASSLGNMMFFRDNPSASAVFEEIIHLKQSRDGRLLADTSIIDELEIEAAQKMIKYQRAYGITDAELEYTKRRLRVLTERRDKK